MDTIILDVKKNVRKYNITFIRVKNTITNMGKINLETYFIIYDDG